MSNCVCVCVSIASGLMGCVRCWAERWAATWRAATLTLSSAWKWSSAFSTLRTSRFQKPRLLCRRSLAHITSPITTAEMCMCDCVYVFACTCVFDLRCRCAHWTRLFFVLFFEHFRNDFHSSAPFIVWAQTWPAVDTGFRVLVFTDFHKKYTQNSPRFYFSPRAHFHPFYNIQIFNWTGKLIDRIEFPQWNITLIWKIRISVLLVRRSYKPVNSWRQTWWRAVSLINISPCWPSQCH